VQHVHAWVFINYVTFVNEKPYLADIVHGGRVIEGAADIAVDTVLKSNPALELLSLQTVA